MANSSQVTVKLPDLDLEEPNKAFFQKAGIQLTNEIGKRTRQEGLDVNRRAFKPYSSRYEKAGQRVDLYTTGHMQGAMQSGVRSSAEGFKVTLSGTQGFKAWANEQIGREWFGMSEKQKDRITKSVTDFFTKKNKLKKR